MIPYGCAPCTTVAIIGSWIRVLTNVDSIAWPSAPACRTRLDPSTSSHADCRLCSEDGVAKEYPFLDFCDRVPLCISNTAEGPSALLVLGRQPVRQVLLYNGDPLHKYGTRVFRKEQNLHECPILYSDWSYSASHRSDIELVRGAGPASTRSGQLPFNKDTGTCHILASGIHPLLWNTSIPSGSVPTLVPPPDGADP